MPTISMCYGILVLMFFRDNQRHHLPHVHARYQGDEAAISLEDGRWKMEDGRWKYFGWKTAAQATQDDAGLD